MLIGFSVSDLYPVFEYILLFSLVVLSFMAWTGPITERRLGNQF